MVYINAAYRNIDMERTGKKLEHCIRLAGFSVKEIQEYLQLSCPQPIYRWFKGKILPSVDHLYMLSLLLEMHMEELLVAKELPMDSTVIRLITYNKRRNRYV